MKIEIVYRKSADAKIVASLRATDRKDFPFLNVFHPEMAVQLIVPSDRYFSPARASYVQSIILNPETSVDQARKKVIQIIAVVKESMEKWRAIQVPENFTKTI